MEAETRVETTVDTETVEDSPRLIPKSLTTIRTKQPAASPQVSETMIVSVEGNGEQPQMEVTTEIIETLSEAIPSALSKTNTAESESGIPCQTILEVFEVDNTETTVSENEEQVAVTMAHTLPAENTELVQHEEDEERRRLFWLKIKTVMESKNSDIILAEKVERIKKVLQKEGKEVDEPSRFMFYIRQRQFSLKVAPELGWHEEVVCEPTREEDTSDDSLLGNWRRVAAAEEIYDIVKEIHEQNVPHKNYRNTYVDTISPTMMWNAGATACLILFVILLMEGHSLCRNFQGPQCAVSVKSAIIPSYKRQSFGPQLLYYSNTRTTFRQEILKCSDVNRNPGPDYMYVKAPCHDQERCTMITMTRTRYSRKELLELCHVSYRIPKFK